MVPGSKIAFLILAHTDMPLLRRLCERLGRHRAFVHVDAKSRRLPMDELAALPNVVVVEPRVAVHWADFSQVQATLSMIQAALACGENFCKLVLISGECYPVKPLHAMATSFGSDHEHNYIRFTPVTSSPHLQKLVARRWRMAPLVPQAALERAPPLRDIERKARAVVNKLSSYHRRDFQAEIGVAPYFGSSWWALSEPCARYVHDFVRDNPGFVTPFRSAYAVDELFYHTIIAHSPFMAATDGIAADLGAQTNQAAPLHLIHPSERRIFGGTEGDLELALSTDKFFIRKVTSADSGALLDRIDRELLQI